MSDPIPGVVSRQKRGFALLSPDVRQLVARRGGIMAHLKGTAHQWTVDEARVAGRKGGSARHSTRGPKRQIA